jgi:hypothetical protein
VLVFVGRVAVKEGGWVAVKDGGRVGELAPATGIRSSSVGEASTLGKFVGVKKSLANAACVSALSSGVAVAVYFGSRTMSSCLSVVPPFNMKGKPNARMEVTSTAKKIT